MHRFADFYLGFSRNRSGPAAAALLAVILGSCAAREEPKIEPNVLPTNYRSEIIYYLQTSLGDPTNIRDAFIAEPALKPSGTESRYIVCLRYNAKNNDGEYSGNKERAAYFYAGQFTTMNDATREQCGTAAYQPFPELQKLCREVVCPSSRR